MLDPHGAHCETNASRLVSSALEHDKLIYMNFSMYVSTPHGRLGTLETKIDRLGPPTLRRSGKLEKSPPENIETEPIKKDEDIEEERDEVAEKVVEESDVVGDIISEVADVDDEGDGVGACVVKPISSNRYPWGTFSPSSSMKKHDVSSTPLSMIWWYARIWSYRDKDKAKIDYCTLCISLLGR